MTDVEKLGDTLRGDAEVERLTELANVGAVRAATAFEKLVARKLRTRLPVVRNLAAPLTDGLWQSGIFFEVEGELGGLVAVFFTPRSRRAVLRRVMDREEEDVSRASAMSALCEIGNIVVSQAVSAVANVLDERITLSVPDLAFDDAESCFAARVARRRGEGRGRRIETEFFDRDDEVRALLVLVPDTL